MEIIINNTKFEIDKADSFYKRFKGLMLKKEITKGLFLPKTNSIHTFFMKSNIDLIMINKRNEVIFYYKNLSKRKIIIKKEAYHTIELPPNSLSKIKLKDKLTIID